MKIKFIRSEEEEYYNQRNKYVIILMALSQMT